LGQVSLDDRYRVVLDRKTRKVAGFKRGDKLVAIPIKGGVILVSPRDPRFAGSLSGFKFAEELHEASNLIFRSRRPTAPKRERKARA
jgi:bifunctional DNA-binding transcriptional regulator/antitoxin component of YhaV-PrlF toxin-antitoxin module